MAKATKKKGYKFSALREEAAKRSGTREPREQLAPFVLDDIQPPIVITAPDTVERQLTIVECIGRDGTFDMHNVLPLLRALCGDQFGRVWSLLKNDTQPDTLITLVQALVEHFQTESVGLGQAMEAEELPGGTEGS